MKLPLIAACLVAGSTWSFASADGLASSNPKTTQKTTAPSPVGSAEQEVIAPKSGARSTSPASTRQPTASKRAQGRAGLSASALAGSTTGTGGTGGGILALNGGDDCASPDVITGNGSWAFDNTAGTTGLEGQLCATNGAGILQDVWFQWTPPYTGFGAFTLCGSTAVNTKMSIYYATTGCPLVTAAPNACNDNGCAPLGPSLITNVPVTFGTTYMVQIGCSPNLGSPGPGGPGTLSIDVPPVPVNDDCANATAITGPGPFAFANNGATGSGTLGLCAQPFGHDIWYDWTAYFSGVCQMTTGLSPTSFDSMIAAYDATLGCPIAGAIPIECNDDGCGGGGTSVMTFTVVAGAHYYLQVMGWGTSSGADGELDMFDTTTVPSNDDCATPINLVGLGTFGYNSLAATTGTQGQAEPLCFGGIDRDIWFTWTAPAGDCTKISNCGGCHDSKMAVYSGSGCPVTGTAIVCNDDFCGTGQSGVAFFATSGATYLIQLGSFTGSLGAAGNLFIEQVPVGLGNDDCASPTLISGAMPLTTLFNNSAATTGCEGQLEAKCGAQGGGSTMEHDIWFTWVATQTGTVKVASCLLTSVDTRLGFYQGAGCPTPNSALACNDDACAFQSSLVSTVHAGTSYTIQVATYPGANGGAGGFSIEYVTPPAPCTDWDDGTSNGNVGYNVAEFDLVWLNRFGNPGVVSEIQSVDAIWGTPAVNGDLTEIFVWTDDASQDGDPGTVLGTKPEATLVLTVPCTVANAGTNVYTNIPLPSPLTVTGYFFVGAHYRTNGPLVGGSGFPMKYDSDNHVWQNVAWLAGVTGAGATYDYAHLAQAGAGVVAALDEQPQLTPAYMMIRIHCTPQPAIYLCTPTPGGVLTPCPCSNPPTGFNRGCNNLSATGGAKITGFGVPSLATPTLFFVTANENPTVASIMLQGTALLSGGSVFGHGIRCVGGSIKRLYAKVAVAGSVTMPVLPTDPNIPARSAILGDTITSGTKRWYMVYYRDSTTLMPGCPAPNQRFNGTNTAEVLWGI